MPIPVRCARHTRTADGVQLAQMQPTYRFGPHLLDVGEQQLSRDGAPRSVQGKVLELLAALLERPGKLWTRDELHDRLWPGVFVSDDALFQAVRKARRALDDNADAPQWIETVPGRGYRFVGTLEAGPAAPPSVAAAPPLPPDETRRPPARSLAPATSFTGRDDLLASLADALAESAGLWTFSGPGGVGKTRLALELTERLQATFSSQPVFCSLETCSEPAGIRAAIGRAIGLAAQSLDRADELVAELASRGPCLLVLDNAEHISRAVADVLTGWQGALPDARIVVTSRVRLGLGTERLVDVPPLVLPPPDADLESLAVHPASALLLDRARTAAGYQPREADASALAALVERLGGLPLALELAAPRLRLLSPSQLHGRMSRVLDLLVGNSADRPSRHLTLRSAIATSWELLDDTDRRGLASLSVFAGPFSVEAAEAAVGGSGDLDAILLLERLLDHSLLRRSDGDAPLQLLPSIREFAAEHVAATDAAWDRMAAWYARSEAFPPPDHRAARQAQAERASLIAALDHAVARGDGAVAAGIALNLSRTLLAHGPLREVGERLSPIRDLPGVAPAALAQLWLREAEALLDGGPVEEVELLLDVAAPLVANDPRGRAALARLRIGALHRRGCVEEALALADAVLADTQLSVADRARFLLDRGRAMVMVHGHSEAANAALRACLTLADTHDLPAVRGSALYELGLNLLLAGDLRNSRQALDQSLECARTVGDVMTEAKARARLGRVLTRLGELDAAEVHLAAAARLCRQAGLVESQGVCAESLGIIQLQRGDYDAALHHYREALAYHAASGHTHLHTVVRGNLGTLLAQMGRYDEARIELREVLAQHQARGRNPGHVLGTLGLIDSRLGELASARVHYIAAIQSQDADGNRRSAGRFRSGLAAVECEMGNFDEATRLIGDAVVALRACEDRDGLGQSLGFAGWIAGFAGRPHDALFDEAEAILGETGVVGPLAIVRSARARVALRCGDRDRAVALRRSSVATAEHISPELAWYLAKLDAELAASAG
jgi:predicted ATPase/DNA-binding winged helix-turn-helix (wHTH) protein/predicted negative regulator of RcsB-dependent stress response